MLSHKTEVRVRFADTDKMQFAYHARYIEYFEIGRTEMLRAYGLPYAKIEEMGYEMPVLQTHVNYRYAARYDELLVVEAVLKDHLSARVHIDYVITKKDSGVLVADGYTELAFIKADTKKAVRPPAFYIEAIERILSETGVSDGK